LSRSPRLTGGLSVCAVETAMACRKAAVDRIRQSASNVCARRCGNRRRRSPLILGEAQRTEAGVDVDVDVDVGQTSSCGDRRLGQIGPRLGLQRPAARDGHLAANESGGGGVARGEVGHVLAGVAAHVLLGDLGVQSRLAEPRQRRGDVVRRGRLDPEVVEPPPAPGFSISTSFSGGSAMTRLA
jgi:hypothetical protein